MVQTISSFYKYVEIENPENLQKEISNLCQTLEIKGRILLGKEGINGSVCGSAESIKKFKAELAKNYLFMGIEYKEQASEKPAFTRLYIAVKKEIVHSGLNVNLKNTAQFITPNELKRMLDTSEDIVMVDVRNNYETRIGKFKGARTLDISKFRELPKAIDEISDLKNKKIIAYCTGGIRCEKASSFLKENGFENVFQLKGGVLRFGGEFPDTYWQGKCFVFDNRISISLNKINEINFLACSLCGNDADNYLNCHSIDCDRLFACCNECKIRFNASCCENCSQNPKRRKKDVVSLN